MDWLKLELAFCAGIKSIDVCLHIKFIPFFTHSIADTLYNSFKI